MRVVILVFVVVLPLLLVVGIAIGYRAGRRRDQSLSLSAVGLSTTTIDRYLDAIRLLNAMVEATTLDGPYGGNILTAATATEARRIVDEYRKEMGINR